MTNKENPHKKYWSTLSEFHQDAEFKKLQKEEFLSKPQSFFESNGDKDMTFSRRDILKLAGAAAVFAAAACASGSSSTIARPPDSSAKCSVSSPSREVPDG